MFKVNFFNKKVRNIFFQYTTGIMSVLSAIFMFWDISIEYKTFVGLGCIAFLIILYFFIWVRANKLKSIDLSIEGSTVTIKTGNIFFEDGLKVIAFNEYFDTQVDNNIISSNSLNGIFIQEHMKCEVEELDSHIAECSHVKEHITDFNCERKTGKKQKYELGTICVWNDYLLTAFSKFNEHNEARLTMPEYLEFLINFWDRINSVYAQRSVSVPVFGSGITRIKEHKNISDEELLKIMLWTFRISEMRFKYPAKLTIIIHESKIDQINLFDLQSARNGL